MNTTRKEYWQGLEDLNKDKAFLESLQKEFPEELPIERIFSEEKTENAHSRRDFLKVMALGSIGAFTTGFGKVPIKKAVPYLLKPEEITPGLASYYASTCGSCESRCAILVKTREGRPIKIEGNKASRVSQGGLCAKGQASLLDLYDNSRLTKPVIKGKYTYHDIIDPKVKAALEKVAQQGGAIRLVTSSISSPSTKKLINQFTKKYPTSKHIMYDAISSYAIQKAHALTFNKAIIPSYCFDKAELIISFGADFLGTWISPIRFTKDYMKKRNAEYISTHKQMSRHIHFESRLSLTGSKADLRVPIKPSEEGLALAYIYDLIAKAKGLPNDPQTFSALRSDLQKALDKVTTQLLASQKRSLVLSGANNLEQQILVNAINYALGNYGESIDMSRASQQRQGNDEDMLHLIKEIKANKVQLILFYNVNPVYNVAGFPVEDLRKVGVKIAISRHYDETAYACDYIYADKHFLESWNDDEPIEGYYHFSQPVFDINHIQGYEVRQGQETLLELLGESDSYYTYIQKHWALLTSTWKKSIHDGVFERDINPTSLQFTGDIRQAQSTIHQKHTSNNQDIELSIYESTQMGDGRSANNPWLQELPDPISKVCWDNYIAISPRMAQEQNLKQGDVLTLSHQNTSIQLPLLLQPGQMYGTISVAFGYGRTKVGQVGIDVGKNITPFIGIEDGLFSYARVSGLTINKTSKTHALAQTQTYHSIKDPFLKKARPIVQEATLESYTKEHAKTTGPKLIDLWPKRPERAESNHSWGLAIDLNTCTGCSACMVACQSENNIPVIGKDQILLQRDMYWIRIDRYYGDEVENPTVLHQPMTCQHCEHAPCETVCPVIATTHTHDGLNHQAYNRCVGTRYCANNCPYKVRRFNWFQFSNNANFDFNMNSPLSRLQLNPDVTVRSRGVMEKCSMCIQRIQDGRLQAKAEGRALQDGEIQTACMQSCPGEAIVFGDLNDKSSRISKLFEDKRKFTVLEDFKTLPSVGYLTLIRNT